MMPSQTAAALADSLDALAGEWKSADDSLEHAAGIRTRIRLIPGAIACSGRSCPGSRPRSGRGGLAPDRALDRGVGLSPV